jgi:hypothetical protein
MASQFDLSVDEVCDSCAMSSTLLYPSTVLPSTRTVYFTTAFYAYLPHRASSAGRKSGAS